MAREKGPKSFGTFEKRSPGADDPSNNTFRVCVSFRQSTEFASHDVAQE